MRAIQIRRLVGTAASSALLATAMLATAAGVQASPPNWVMDVVALPGSVAPGATAGYSVTITNNGPSNISNLYLVTKTEAAPVYIDDSAGRDGCPDGGVLKCSFGALNAGDHVTVIAAYTTTGSGSFDPGFEGNTTGQAFTDPKRSHGDTLVDLDFGGTTLRADKNFGGAFNLAANGQVSNSHALTGTNKQATTVANLASAVAATVEDGTGTTGYCANDPALGIDCSKLFGEWSVVNVGTGGPFTPAITIQITFKTGTPTAFVHSRGTSQELVKSCAETGGTLPCFTWDASTNTATITTQYNGSWKGL